jgi:hypothetical protein
VGAAVAVPRTWAGETVVCLATGPSLCAEDVEYCRGKARVIAVNDAYRLAPWADALYAADASWWHRHDGVPSFPGPKWSIAHRGWDRFVERFPDVQRLRNAGARGISTDPTAINTGQNSGYQAVNLAVLYGASRIVLLGYDMGYRDTGHKHFFGNHPGALNQQPPFHAFIDLFTSAVAPLKALGIEIVNCSRVTRLGCFTKAPLRDVLLERAA